VGDPLHRGKENVALGRSAVLFVLRVLVGRYCQGLLLHEGINA
jgi:hypothetical protein